MKRKVITIMLVLVLVLSVLSACGSTDAKAAYKPPAEVFGVKISGTSEPEIEGVKFTYDSKARIDTVSYSVDDYDYQQEYSYDNEQIVIKTIYKTEIIEEKIIKYVEIPANEGFTTVDGYYIRVTDDMPVEIDNKASATGTDKKLVETAETINQTFESGLSVTYRIPKVNIDSNDANTVSSEIYELYNNVVDSEPAGFDYAYYSYNDLISVVVGCTYNTEPDIYTVYTFDTSTGKRLNNDDIMSSFSKNQDQITDSLINAVGSFYDSGFQYDWRNEDEETYQNYQKTISNDNMKGYSLFVGKNGLMAVLNTYITSSFSSDVIYDLNTHESYRSFP